MLARVPPRLVERRPAVDEVAYRLLAGEPHRLLERRARGRDVGPVEQRLHAPDRGVERFGGEAGALEPGEHLLERRELLARGLEVLGEAADAVERLLRGRERLGVDLEPKRLAGPVHRGEDRRRVATEASGAGDPGRTSSSSPATTVTIGSSAAVRASASSVGISSGAAFGNRAIAP